MKHYVFLACFLGFMAATVYVLYAADYRYVASKFSLKYHLPTCNQVRGLQEQNRIVFNTADEAVKAGYVPCGICRPPTSESGIKN